MPRTMLDKIWDQHVITELGSGLDLIHIDPHPGAFDDSYTP